MNSEVNGMESREEQINNPITDCAHLIDLPPADDTFNQKMQGNPIQNPKACISVLTKFYPKNGLANLL